MGAWRVMYSSYRAQRTAFSVRSQYNFLWPRIREILLPEGTCILEEICQFPVLVRASAVTPPASGTDSLHPPVASSLVPPF